MNVRRVSPGEVVDLRHRVLRDGLPRSAAIFEGDDEPTTLHFAAFGDDAAADDPGLSAVIDSNRMVGCVTILRRPRDAAPGWQLRGMAVDPTHQRAGVGGALLAAVDAHVAGDDFSRALWCNARVPAIPFYARHGWTVASEPFDIPTAGPHRIMVKDLG